MVGVCGTATGCNYYIINIKNIPNLHSPINLSIIFYFQQIKKPGKQTVAYFYHYVGVTRVHARGGICVGLKGDVGAPGARLGGVLCGVKRCCGVKGSVRANTSVHSCWG